VLSNLTPHPSSCASNFVQKKTVKNLSFTKISVIHESV
jgi:hypothetical protein